MHEDRPTIGFEDFEKVDVRVGQIVEVEDFPRARKPSYKLKVDFGEKIGIKTSSIQAKADYAPEELRGLQVIGVVNFTPKNIAGFLSEVLILGVPSAEGGLSILTPSISAVLGGKMY